MRRTTVTVIVCIGLLLFPGCTAFQQKRRFDALTQPVSYSAPTSDDGDARGLAGKARSACAKAGRMVVTGVALLGCLVLHLWLDDDDDDEEKSGFDPDPLWHAGYGFNNPNAERRKNRQPGRINFDGTVAD